MVVLPLDLVNLLLAAVLPMVTALVTARFANSSVKALTLAVLTIITTALQQVFNDDGEFFWRAFLITAAVQFTVSVGLHFGLLKPTGVTGGTGAIAGAVPAGIGGSPDATDPKQ
jgi:hypothetical protein